MTLEKVILIEPRGYCAGVDRAIDVVEDSLELFDSSVYVKHQIVHNKHVVEGLEKKGAVTVDTVDEIPYGATAIFSAHGSKPDDYSKAEERGIRVIDAACPLVTKVHREVHIFAKEGYKIIYIGHKGHIEAEGVIGELPGEIPIVRTPEDVEKLNIGNPEKLVYLTQTTLSVDETKNTIKAIKEKYPQVIDPPKEDICPATTNRQKAIKELANYVDLILVIGSKNSSNSNRLVETARFLGVNTFLLDDVSELDPIWLDDVKNIGISSGASAPDYLVQELADYIVNLGAKKEVLTVLKEDMKFKEPIELLKIKREKGILT